MLHFNRNALQWRHNERDSVSNHQPHDCLLSRLFRRRSKKTSKLRVTGFCAGNSPGTGEFSAQMASNAESVSIWWRQHAYTNEYTEGNVPRENTQAFFEISQLSCQYRNYHYNNKTILWSSTHDDGISFQETLSVCWDTGQNTTAFYIIIAQHSSNDPWNAHIVLCFPNISIKADKHDKLRYLYGMC